MPAKYLKKTDELQIIRVQKGELGKFPAPHTTTVGDAIFNGRVSVMVKDAWEE